VTESADRPGEVRIAPVGDLDLVTGESLEGEIRRRMSDTTERVVVDLRGVGLLDSTGLRVLITLRNHARRNGHRLALVAGPPPVQRVFQLTATRGLFDWLEDPDPPAPGPSTGPPRQDAAPA
jgi:anti-sigma B factor antagonist